MAERMNLFSWTLDRPMPAPHVHPEVEVVVVERGWLIHEQSGVQVRLEPGDLIAHWAAFPHGSGPCARGTRILLLYLPLTLFTADPALAPLLGRWLRRDHLVGRGDHRPWAQACLAAFAESHPLAQRALELEILARLLRIEAAAGPTPAGGDLADRHVATIVSRIVASSSEPLSIAAIAAAVGLSPNHAMRVFRRVTGLGLWPFVQRVRIVQAQRLLRDPERTVLDVALATGFGSVRRFHAVFRALTDETPDAYRRRQALTHRA